MTRLLVVQADLWPVLFGVIIGGTLIVVFLLLVRIVLRPVVLVVSVEQIFGGAALCRRGFASELVGFACSSEIMNERGRSELVAGIRNRNWK